MLGKERSSTLTTTNDVASVLTRQGKYEEAEEIHLTTLNLVGRKIQGTVMSMTNLALLY